MQQQGNHSLPHFKGIESIDQAKLKKMVILFILPQLNFNITEILAILHIGKKKAKMKCAYLLSV